MVHFKLLSRTKRAGVFDLKFKIAREKRSNTCRTHRTADWEWKIARENATARKKEKMPSDSDSKQLGGENAGGKRPCACGVCCAGRNSDLNLNPTPIGAPPAYISMTNRVDPSIHQLITHLPSSLDPPLPSSPPPSTEARSPSVALARWRWPRASDLLLPSSAPATPPPP